MDDLPLRPLPARTMSASVREWLQWFGIGRLLVSALAVAGVGAGAFWLLRAPATPVESTLPFATTTTAGPRSDDADDTSASPVDAASGTTTTQPTEVVVYVAGAVVAPAVYSLAAGARVTDAIAAAGGISSDADTDGLNLAAVLRDGDRVYVPRAGQPVPAVISPESGGATATASSAPAGPVDLNDASAAELDALPGIGPTTAEAIVAHRERGGPFLSVDDLLDVRGIGPAKLEAIRDLVTV